MCVDLNVSGGTVIFQNRRRQRRVSGKTRRRTLEMTECGHKPVCVLHVFVRRVFGCVCACVIVCFFSVGMGVSF